MHKVNYIANNWLIIKKNNEILEEKVQYLNKNIAIKVLFQYKKSELETSVYSVVARKN